MVNAWGMKKLVEWESPPTPFAALDPAFVSDGDSCMLVRGYLGRERGVGRAVIAYDPDLHVIPISASSGVPVLQQIGHATRDKLYEWGIPVNRLAVDDSGTQSVADYIEILMGRGVYRCNYSKKPPDLPMSVNATATVDTRYRNTVTWLYYNFHEFAQYGQIKGLPKRAEEELCTRQLDKKLKGLLILETKTAYKKRMKDGTSPDAADACVMLAGMIRHRYGFVPGSNSYNASGEPIDESDWFPDGMAGLAREMNGMNDMDSGGRYV